MDQNVKQQIVESINGTTNVLVTVSSDPSVDELAACIGLTLVLNKLGKHATAVFSGKVPSTIAFLKPDETLEDNTDSLRDFIIALDKSKADKLRYKVEEDVVKIFITPYKTSLGQKDLEFSQGDFNVDVVIALGVHKREELDRAITSHGRILHDATVVCINSEQVSNLGVYNWQDPEASSLCEMVVDMAETIQPDNFDAQMATALLTGIVAETARFSNEKTTPRTMSLSAKLMAAGANQQLVASKLQTNLDKSEVGLQEEPEVAVDEEESDGTLRIAHTPEDDDDHKESSSSENPFEENEEPEDEDNALDEEPLEKPQTPRQEKRLEPTPPQIEEEPLEEEQPASSSPSEEAPESPQSQISDVKVGQTEAPQPGFPRPQNPMRPGSSRLAYEPPVMGGTLTANSRPEPLDPPTDGLNLPTPVNAPILNHAPSKIGQDDQDKPIIDEETLTHIEKSVGSPHVEESTTPSGGQPSTNIDELSQAAKEAAEVIENPGQLEPLIASGSSALDMNVQENNPSPAAPSVAEDVPIAEDNLPELPIEPQTPIQPLPTPGVNDVLAATAQSDLPVAPAFPAPESPAPLDNNLPSQIVPADQGPPPEQTASDTAKPLPPPPVPPPLTPGTFPPAGSTNQPPQPPYPPAPTQ